GPRWERLGFSGPLLSPRQVHVADGALLLRVVTDDVWVHRAEVFGVRVGSLRFASGPGPLLVVGAERVPIGAQAPDRDQNDEKAEPSLQRFQPQPNLPPEAVFWRLHRLCSARRTLSQ